MKRLCLSAAALAIAAACLWAAPASQPAADTGARVADIIKNRCVTCHQHAAWTIENISAKPNRVVPGNPDASRLYTTVKAGRHGKTKQGNMTADEIEAIRAWIAAGAPKPGAGAPAQVRLTSAPASAPARPASAPASKPSSRPAAAT
jgi:mono/diheme cytochrome c family protein